MAHKFYLKRYLNDGVERWTLYEARTRGRTKVATLRGWRLSLALPYVKKIVQASQRLKKPDESDRTQNILEEDGVRLALTFIGVRNLKKLERAENLCREIHSMSQEEAYYWYSKALGRTYQTSGVRALRMLFGS